MSLTEEINEAIEKDLPNQIGKQLKERLDKAERDNEDLNSALQREEELTEELDSANDRLSKHCELDLRENAVKVREDNAAEQERNQEVVKLTTQLDEANKRADMVMNFTQGLVRNTEFRKSIHENEGMTSEYNSATSQYDNKPTGTKDTDILTTKE